MRTIKLTQGKFTLVDDDMFDYLNQWKWHYSCGRAVRLLWTYPNNKKKGTIILMHRLINKTPKGFDTDHIDRNPLNNQKNNLRTVTHSINLHNRPKQKNNTSGFKGVYFDKQTNKWRSQIGIKGKVIQLGRFNNINDALRTRLQFEKIHIYV